MHLRRRLRTIDDDAEHGPRISIVPALHDWPFGFAGFNARLFFELERQQFGVELQ